MNGKESIDTELGFAEVPESERTRHVHKLHPYLGKFIPQLAEHFLKKHFRVGDWILDPFMGSGTTLIQANELGIHSIGCDISEFNCKIVRTKSEVYELDAVEIEIQSALDRVKAFSSDRFNPDRNEPPGALKDFHTESDYLKTWFAERALQEMLFYRSIIPDYEHQDLLMVVLSRAARSSRLVAHFDIAAPRAPMREPYYCYKHNRTCKPIQQCLKFLRKYSKDSLLRLREFEKVRTAAEIHVISADARSLGLEHKLDGIFTSPPYAGAIDYHQQHIYAYELFDIERREEQEIGPKIGGRSKKARDEYVSEIAQALRNAKRFLKPGAPIFIVAHDSFNLYPSIAEQSGLRIVEEHQRAVTSRTERETRPYNESIFVMVDGD
ncbi:MAG: DNA methyltransferase [Planctomycetota bacterium]|nr:DNA methyltransferase [Planctomycetota bacterium]